MEVVGENAGRYAPGSVLGSVGSNQSIDLANDLGISGVNPGDGANLAYNLLRTHPTYNQEVKKWLKYLDLYESNDVYRYIFRHNRETESSWQNRVARGYFSNYVESVVDLFIDYIFAAPIARDVGDADKFFPEKWYKNVDFKSTTYKSFMMDVGTYAKVEGHVGIMVDAPDVGEGLTERDRISGDIRPYLTLLHAHQILDWKLDRFGRFDWVKIVLCAEADREWTEAIEGEARTVIIISKTQWLVYSISGESGAEVAELTREGENQLGEVPIVICKYQKMARHPWFGISQIRDIADINIGILNWSSLGDEEIFERCLNVLCVQKQSDDSQVALSHHNVLEYDGDTAPSYLTPGATPLDLIQKWIQFHIDDIMRLAKLTGAAGMKDVRSATSGIAYAFEFNETNQTLCNMAESLEQADYEIHRLVAKYFGNEFSGSVAYPREFGVDDLISELNALTQARTALTTETGIKEFEKKVLRKMFSKTTEELRKKMAKEVEEGDPKPSFETLIGTKPPGNAPSPDGGPNSSSDGLGNMDGTAPAEDAGKGNSEPKSGA